MIKINLKHRDRTLLNHYSGILGKDLKAIFGKKVLGPEFPLISRIQSLYIKTILIKLEKGKSIASSKRSVSEALERLETEKGASGLRIAIDVDPY